MSHRMGRHLRLIPGDAHHVLLTEVYDDETAEVACTCGEQWSRMPTVFLEALAEHHEGAIYA